MSNMHRSPIVDSIVFNLIREVHFENFRFSKKETIDTSAVPHVSEGILIRKGFHESIAPRLAQPTLIPQFIPVKKPEISKSPKISPPEPKPKELESKGPEGFEESIIEGDKNLVKKEEISSIPEVQKITQTITSTRVVTPLPPQIQRAPQIIPINLFQNPPNYGKLNMLIRDQSIDYIDCPGPDQRIIVTRMGQRQQTNIYLTKVEIQILLNNLSSKTKIPLITGVFRVSWDNFVINAIVSDSLEPRFLIKRERN